MPPVKKSKAKPKASTLDFGSRSSGSSKAKKPLSQVLSNPPLPSASPTLPKDVKGKGKSREVIIDHQLWVDKYEPQNKEELAVHKQKVEQVSRWLTEAFDDSGNGKLRKYRVGYLLYSAHLADIILNNCNQRILTLTGPAGTGKTSTLRVLSRSLGIQILEWKNSFDDVFYDFPGTNFDRDSLISKFTNFLTRATRYSTLDFSSASSSQGFSDKRLVLLEDLPNILHPRTREAFHSALQEFVLSPAPPACPLVIIISDAGTRGETGAGESSAWKDRANEALDIRTVLPKDLLNSPYVVNIPFNPIAITYLRRAVPALLSKYFSNPSSSLPPSKDLVNNVLENANGDIRSAIMTLQFACTVDYPNSASTSRKKGEKEKRAKATKAILEAITQREQSLHLFHLLGKVLYNKRYGDDPEEFEEEGPPPKLPQLPTHLAEYGRRASKVDPTILYSDSPIDASMMALYIHQNYTQFCHEVDHAEALCEWLSVSDLFSGAHGDMWSSQNQLREYSFWAMSAGSLHSLPSPVARRSQKIMKPEWFDIIRRTKLAAEEVDKLYARLSDLEREDRPTIMTWTKDSVATEMATMLKNGMLHYSLTAGLDLELISDFQLGVAPTLAKLMTSGDELEFDDEDRYPESIPRGASDELESLRAQRPGWLEEDEIDEY